jgi:SAM-dependent methyltransferase
MRKDGGQTAGVSRTYSDVDGSADPAGAVDWQERMATWPGVAAYKRRTHQLLEGADPVLDVGSGAGDDLVGLGVERSVGADRSRAMCSRSAQRGARVVQADAAALPFRDAAFGGARSDRTFQHLDDPVPALRELLRVLRSGAPVVIADPDQESLVIEVFGVRRSVLDRLKVLRRDVGYRNGRWISRAPALLERVGVDVTSVDAFPLTIRDPADAFGLLDWPTVWRDEGGFTDDELAEWQAAMRGSQDGFLFCVTFFVVAGRKR